jgi:replicative DNA helicase
MIETYDRRAEQAVLGALLNNPRLLATMPLDTEHFHPQHQPILLAIRSAVSEHETPQVDQVLRELITRDRSSAAGGGPYLLELTQLAALPANLSYYTEMINAATLRRRLKIIAGRLLQTAESADDLDDMLDMAARQYAELAVLVDEGVEIEQPINGLSEVREFMSEQVAPYSWVIPGILEHTDRCVLTAPEGGGKSVLMRQLAMLTASGRHPFIPKIRIPAKRTLIVDLENPPSLVRRNMKGTYTRLTNDRLELGDRAWIWREPGGIDIRTPQGFRLLERVVDRANPDLVCIGPAYKMSTSHGDKYEIEAAEVQQAIDRLRMKYGCAFWIEHHAAKGQGGQERSGEPFGSSYWMRWPEFGLVLKPAENAEANTYTFGRFRNDRDVRMWPSTLLKSPSLAVADYPWRCDWSDREQLHDLMRLSEEAFQ